MKKITLIVAALFVAVSALAQDVIVTKDSRRINAKVTEVNVDNIRYKQFDNQDGSVYTLPKSDIVTILYQNGQVENYGAGSSPASTSAVAVSSATINAQNKVLSAPSKEAQWGIKEGLNVARDLNSDGERGPRIGIHVGGFMEKAISNGVDFQLELLYSMQGGIYKFGGTNNTDMIDYITVPMMFRIYVNKNRRFSIDLGLQFGYMVSFKSLNGSKTTNLNDHDGLNKFEAALGSGASYKINDQFDLIFRGTQGLTNIVDVYDEEYNYQFGVGYRF